VYWVSGALTGAWSIKLFEATGHKDMGDYLVQLESDVVVSSGLDMQYNIMITCTFFDADFVWNKVTNDC
jgi:hypothetical protein